MDCSYSTMAKVIGDADAMRIDEAEAAHMRAQAAKAEDLACKREGSLEDEYPMPASMGNKGEQ